MRTIRGGGVPGNGKIAEPGGVIIAEHLDRIAGCIHQAVAHGGIEVLLVFFNSHDIAVFHKGLSIFEEFLNRWVFSNFVVLYKRDLTLSIKNTAKYCQAGGVITSAAGSLLQRRRRFTDALRSASRGLHVFRFAYAEILFRNTAPVPDCTGRRLK